MKRSRAVLKTGSTSQLARIHQWTYGLLSETVTATSGLLEVLEAVAEGAIEHDPEYDVNDVSGPG